VSILFFLLIILFIVTMRYVEIHLEYKTSFSHVSV